MGALRLLGWCLALASGSLGAVAALLLALLWGLEESSALRPGKGVELPSTLYGHTAIVTGSSSGIGFEAALALYRLGTHVVVHSPDPARAAKAAKDVERLGADGQGLGKATPLAANLCDFNAVRSFASIAATTLRPVDLLVLNAAKMYGLAPWYGDKTLLNQPDWIFKAPSGHDRVLAVNHLGHFLLTELLLPHLAHGARILIMTSIGAWDGSPARLMPPWGRLGKYQLSPGSANEKRIFWEQKGLKPHAYLAYRDTKFANICYGRHLRRRLRGNATVVIHDPGMVVTTPTMSRESKSYKERLYRNARGDKIVNWHAPTEDGGTHLLQALFVTTRPVPDVITPYFFPRQFVSWFAGKEWQNTRFGYVGRFPGYQRLTWGLHATIGPDCDEEFQERLARWSARETGLAA